MTKRSSKPPNSNGDRIFSFASFSEEVATGEFLEAPDGAEWGAIPDCLIPYPGTKEIPRGRIIVPKGNVAHGYIHVTKRHASKIQNVSGMSVDAYLCDVLRNYQIIYLQADGSLWIFRSNGMRKCAVLSSLILDGRLAYQLITAYPIDRLPNFSSRGAIKLKVG